MHGVRFYFMLYVFLAGFFLSVPGALAESALPERTAALIKRCGLCHGDDGNSQIATIPSFAGINPDYFAFSLETYKNGNRVSTVMRPFAAELSEQDIHELATYYAAQTYRPGEQAYQDALAEKGKVIHTKYCAKCHEDNGYPGPYSFGILAGQWMPYLRLTLREYLDETRATNPVMLIKLKKSQAEFGDQSIEQLVHFYASVRSAATQ